jgi:hypothetical protein
VLGKAPLLHHSCTSLLQSFFEGFMKIEILLDVDAAARKAAANIAMEARSAVKARGRFIVAVSGGRSHLRSLSSL